MKRLLTLGILLLCWGARGATVATDGSFGDVQTKVSGATDGDTVTVPPGDFNWGSALSITRGIYLKGAGRTSTRVRITSGGNGIDITPSATTISIDATNRIEGFTFDGNGTMQQMIFVHARGVTNLKPFNNFVFGNNTISNIDGGSGTSIYIQGQVRGCIYSNILDMVNMTLRYFGNNDFDGTGTDEWNSGRFPQSLGTSDQLFFEGNIIKWSSSYTATDPGYSETGQGARAVFRYNTYNYANNTHFGFDLQDNHGFQNVDASQAQDGTMCSEYYGNTYIGSGSTKLLISRGGWVLFFNNRFVNSTPSSYFAVQQYGPDGVQSGCMAAIAARFPSYNLNYNGELTNHYIWNNEWNGVGSLMPVSYVDVGGSCSIQINRNWWTDLGSFTSTTGIGKGTGAPAITPVSRIAYWQNATPSPSTSPSVIQNGTLYIAFNPPNWTTYRPYLFPHPLSGGSAIGTNPVTLISPGQLTWVMNPSSGSSNKTFTVQNAGGGTLTGFVALASSGGAFSFSGTTNYSLASNATTTITVTYTAPAGVTTVSSNLVTFADNGGGSSATVQGNAPRVYVWPLGDSITQGHDVNGGYRLPLYNLLTNNGVNVWFVGNAGDNSTNLTPACVWHDGYGGYEITNGVNSGLAENVNSWFGNLGATPNYILLMIGFNDYRLNDRTATATNRLESLIVRLATLAPSATIFVADLNPWVNLATTNNTMETYYNPYIPSIVARQLGLGRNVKLADMRGKLAPTDLESDNTHPTQNGYNIIATNWFAAIQGTPTPPSVVTQPVGVTNFYGSTLNISVVVSGTPTLSYQWRINSNAIGGASSATYSKSNVSTNDQGWYDVLIANSYGSTSSIPVYVSLSANPNVPPGLVNNGVTGAQVSWNSMVLPITSSGANRMLLYYGYTYDAGGALVTNVTFNGSEQFTQLARTNYYDSFGEIHLWYLINPSLATANVLVNGDSLDEIAGRVMLVTNVNQSSPFEAVSMSFVQNGSPVTSDTLTPTQTTNELVIDALVSSGSLWNPSATLIGNISAPNGTFFCDSQAPGTSPATSMTWSGGSDMISHIAVAIKPAAGAPVVPPGVKVVIHGKMSIRGKASIR